MTTYYAIKHTETGNLMPVDRRRGSTFWKGEAQSGIPRLFKEKHHASSAIMHWLKGELYVTYSHSSHIPEDCDVDWRYKDVGRKSDDVEIVAVRVMEIMQ